MERTRRAWKWAPACLALLLGQSVVAQVNEPFDPYASGVPSVDWYYASAFGTGQYRAGERTVTVLRIPLAWKIPDSSDRAWSVRIIAPLTIGAVDFGLDDIVEQPLDSVSQLTFTPGVEFSLPWREAWVARAFATLGGGVEFDGDDRAWIYSLGISAQRELTCRNWECRLGLSMTWAGFNSNTNQRDSMSNLAAGFDLIAPNGPEFFDRELRAGVFLVYRNYLSELDFIFDPLGIEPLRQEWELGLSLNASKPFSLLGYRFDRFGLSYRRSGNLRGIHLVSTFPF